MSLALALGACSQVTSPTPEKRDLGSNVKVFDPSMSTAEIQAAVDAVKAQQLDAEFGEGRYALFFKPGTYGTSEKPLFIDVGYYTEVVGLGRTPNDVVINGHVNVYNRCLGTEGGKPSNCLALDNFWRAASNLTVKVAGGVDCQKDTNFWAVSQAAPLRRMNIIGKFSLMDYCSAGPQYASGGFIADSKFSGTDAVINGSQQQFMVRDSEVPGWSNGVWNQVFSGVVGAPATSFGTTGGDGKPANPYTTLPTTPVSREKPYLYLDAQGAYQVFVPATRQNTSGVSWSSGAESGGRTLPLTAFFIARPTDTTATINAALASGRNVLFTPGMYTIGQSLQVTKANTVVLGLGLATLTAQNGAVPMTVADVDGVDIAGLTFDAGPVNSPVLLKIGSSNASGSLTNPVALHDVFFRIGGPHLGKATTSLEVNRSGTLLDHLWVWRADHGEGVGWTMNTADHGVIINGDDVTATGLFVEHFQKEEVIWNGERGQTIMFQNEMPYDPPNQAAWNNGATLGYAAYKVADSVKTHQGWGMGSYIYMNVDPTIHASQAFVAPVTSGVKLHSLLTVQLNKGLGIIDHVVNQTGDPVTGDPATGKPAGTPSMVINFP
ncbi:glycoside hydrolase family 55 protein (plasmid) [Deinococcus sp. KNUC1210]|uniref:glycoside hydrolase family 55 protein n=1 Tax=Deinococcus sp. KNUC1210 TaxID=2917691 RepID=UPI001EEFD386|nr:glycoside hydrolase family 55 protein [Deinococcus sp. KNUC1210]ULH18328.1 glycoside hydrolase family 55 protein [Deinococcus sp. KNUC1210]